MYTCGCAAGRYPALLSLQGGWSRRRMGEGPNGHSPSPSSCPSPPPASYRASHSSVGSVWLPLTFPGKLSFRYCMTRRQLWHPFLSLQFQQPSMTEYQNQRGMVGGLRRTLFMGTSSLLAGFAPFFQLKSTSATWKMRFSSKAASSSSSTGMFFRACSLAMRIISTLHFWISPLRKTNALAISLPSMPEE